MQVFNGNGQLMKVKANLGIPENISNKAEPRVCSNCVQIEEHGKKERKKGKN